MNTPGFMRNMTLCELRDMLAKLKFDDDKKIGIKVWLPGSYITVAASIPQVAPGPDGEPACILFEGNLDEGSALS